MKPKITKEKKIKNFKPLDLFKAKAYADTMCELRQNVIDRATEWKNFKGENIYSVEMKLSDAVESLEKFKKKGKS